MECRIKTCIDEIKKKCGSAKILVRYRGGFSGGVQGGAHPPPQNFLAPPQEKIERNWDRYWQLINYYITNKEQCDTLQICRVGLNLASY